MDRTLEINQLHSELCKLVKTTVEKAIRIGELLIEQKSECGHGNWYSWLESNIKFGKSTAQQYMSMYRNRDRLKSLSDRDLKFIELARVSELPDPTEKIKLTEEEKYLQERQKLKERRTDAEAIMEARRAEYRAAGKPVPDNVDMSFPMYRVDFDCYWEEVKFKYDYDQQAEIALELVKHLWSQYPEISEPEFKFKVVKD